MLRWSWAAGTAPAAFEEGLQEWFRNAEHRLIQVLGIPRDEAFKYQGRDKGLVLETITIDKLAWVPVTYRFSRGTHAWLGLHAMALRAEAIVLRSHDRANAGAWASRRRLRKRMSKLELGMEAVPSDSKAR